MALVCTTVLESSQENTSVRILFPRVLIQPMRLSTVEEQISLKRSHRHRAALRLASSWRPAATRRRSPRPRRNRWRARSRPRPPRRAGSRPPPPAPRRTPPPGAAGSPRCSRLDSAVKLPNRQPFFMLSWLSRFLPLSMYARNRCRRRQRVVRSVCRMLSSAPAKYRSITSRPKGLLRGEVVRERAPAARPPPARCRARLAPPSHVRGRPACRRAAAFRGGRAWAWVNNTLVRIAGQIGS